MLELVRRASAKINLALRVLGRRADGYHELDSLFLPLVDPADEVTVAVDAAGAGVSCRCVEAPALDGVDNLAARAARAYLERCGRTARVEITITKRIWIAAGLGGGSSDAAAVLVALRELVGGLDGAALAALALELGADVPFFLDPRPSRARGVGERLTPLPPLPPLFVVLLNPGRPLSTAGVYAALGLAPGAQGDSPPFSDAELARLAVDPAALVANDLAAPAIRLCPEIAAMRQALLAAGASAASLSGSGPTVFGLFPDPAAARGAADNLLATTGFSVLATSTGNP